MTVLRLATASLRNRKGTVILTILAIAISVALLLGVEKLRRDAKSAFANTISGTDLIVGARTGAIQLLLYSVFRIGNATNNISWDSYQQIREMPRVKWTVPLSLGDSFRGYRVLGTNTDYFEHYRYSNKTRLRFRQGVVFSEVFDAVLGAHVAKELDLSLGDQIVVSHGAGAVSFIAHDDKPFRVTGILAPTGTPVDRTVHVSLPGIEAIHIDWEDGMPKRGLRISAEEVVKMDLRPKAITAFMVGLDTKRAIFSTQRSINQFPREPLMAIVPGIALQELWDLLDVAETALRVISVMVVVTGLLGMLTVILASLEARRREMAVLRAVGARASHVFLLFVIESAVLAFVGIILGVIILAIATLVGGAISAEVYGLPLSPPSLTGSDLVILLAVLIAAVVAGCIPAIRAYRHSLADGLSIKM